MSARTTHFPARLTRTMGEVEENTWTCIAAETDGTIDAGAIGVRTMTRRVYFAYRCECALWIAEHEARGWNLSHGPTSAATFYHGPTDAPGNCWSAEVERVMA